MWGPMGPLVASQSRRSVSGKCRCTCNCKQEAVTIYKTPGGNDWDVCDDCLEGLTEEGHTPWL